MEFGFDNFWDIVGTVASIAKIVTLIAAVVVIVRAKQRWDRISKTLADRAEGARPAVIAVGIGGSIKGTVEAYLKAKYPDAEMPVAEVRRDNFLQPSEMPGVLHELLKLKQKLMDQGVTEAHLFYRGPVTLAMGIGAVLDNWVPVHVYELDKSSGSYKVDLTLDKGAVFGLNAVEDVLTEGEQVILERMAESH